MATVGSTSDIRHRLFNLQPYSWYKGNAPELNAALEGIADSQSYGYSTIAYARAQTRLQSTTDGFLDILAWDYFGPRIQRLAGETDTAFSVRILKEILRPRATRPAIIQMITDLTGLAPVYQDPANPADYAGYGRSYYGYCQYGSLLLRNQIFLTVYRPLGGGIATIAGYGYGYYGASTTAYVSLSQITAPITDAMIYAAIAYTIAAGITAWVQIKNPPAAGSNQVFDNEFIPLFGSGAG